MDELPQLVNILFGEMSLVGPRPELACSLQYCEPWHIRRFETKPGLSGLWQVSGKTKTTFNEMMRLDIKYIKKRSFWLDVLIMLKTIPTIFSEARR
jgi:lipopolysaccharide/colanic/teichoic acid biosynthesis glycosyltransferase